MSNAKGEQYKGYTILCGMGRFWVYDADLTEALWQATSLERAKLWVDNLLDYDYHQQSGCGAIPAN